MSSSAWSGSGWSHDGPADRGIIVQNADGSITIIDSMDKHPLTLANKPTPSDPFNVPPVTYELPENPGWRHLGPVDDNAAHIPVVKESARFGDMPPDVLQRISFVAYPGKYDGRGRQTIRDLLSIVELPNLSSGLRNALLGPQRDGEGWLEKRCQVLLQRLGVGRPVRYKDISYRLIAARTIDMYARNDCAGPHRMEHKLGCGREELQRLVMGMEDNTAGVETRPFRYDFPMKSSRLTAWKGENCWRTEGVKEFFAPVDLADLPRTTPTTANASPPGDPWHRAVAYEPRRYDIVIPQFESDRKVVATPDLFGNHQSPFHSPHLRGPSLEPSLKYPPMGFATCPPVQKLEVFFGAIVGVPQEADQVVDIGRVEVWNEEGVTLMDLDEKFEEMLDTPAPNPDPRLLAILQPTSTLMSLVVRAGGSRWRAKTNRELMAGWQRAGLPHDRVPEALPFAVSGKTAVLWRARRPV